MTAHQTLDRDTLHEMLVALPVHVLCFDEGFICRYAAPAGTHFLGLEPDELIGRTADEVLPQGDRIRADLEAVLRSGETRRIEHLDFPAAADGSWPAGAWTLHAQPHVLRRARRGVRQQAVYEPSEEATNRGAGRHRRRIKVVLVTCYRCVCSACCALPSAAPPEAPASGPVQPLVWDDGETEARRSAILLERIRTKLTVIRGFAQLLRRRSQGGEAERLDEVERINEAAGELDDLLARYESHGWPQL